MTLSYKRNAPINKRKLKLTIPNIIILSSIVLVITTTTSARYNKNIQQ